MGWQPHPHWALTGRRRFRVSFFRHKLIAQVEEEFDFGIPEVVNNRRWRDATLADLKDSEPSTPPPGPKK